MRKLLVQIGASVLMASLAPATVSAATVTYSSKSLFLADTGAADATGNYANLGNVYSGASTSRTFGSVTFTLGPDTNQLWFGTSGLAISDWTGLLAGHDLAIGGPENLNASFSGAVYAMGFDFVEPTSLNVNAPFQDSSFVVSLLLGASVVDAFGFSRPNDTAAFVGVWSDAAFDRVEIREVYNPAQPLSAAENEFFGHFYSGTRSLNNGSTLPEPGSLALVLPACGLAALGSLRRRARSGLAR